MKKQKNQKDNLRLGIVVLGVLLFAFSHCKNPNGPDSNFKATLTIKNFCGATVEIYLDDNLIISVANGFEQFIDNITKGSHLLEAFKAGTDMLVATESVDFSTSGDYFWELYGPARIIVTNDYGETLRILINGEYLGDLDDTFSEEITKVTFGEHKLEAVKVSDDDVAASTTISVQEVKEYFWTIK